MRCLNRNTTTLNSMSQLLDIYRYRYRLNDNELFNFNNYYLKLERRK